MHAVMERRGRTVAGRMRIAPDDRSELATWQRPQTATLGSEAAAVSVSMPPPTTALATAVASLKRLNVGLARAKAVAAVMGGGSPARQDKAEAARVKLMPRRAT
mgnify:CR=1 FL=1